MTAIENPTASDDYQSAFETDVISGNLLDNDVAGANGNMFLHFFDGDSVLAKKPGQITDIDGEYGTFHIKADGSYIYTLSEAAKAGFHDGMTLMETVSYKISDGSGNTDVGLFKLDIHGVTSAPVAADDAFSFRESGAMAGNVLANDIAGEAGHLFLRSADGTGIGAKQGPGEITDVAGEFGTFHFAADGAFTYDLDPAVKAGLNAGERVTEKLDYYKVSDGAGHTDAGVITLTVDGEGKSLNLDHVEVSADVVRPFLDHYEIQGVAIDPQTGKYYVTSGHGFPDDSMVSIYDNAAAFEADHASGAISLKGYDIPSDYYDIGGTYFAVSGGEIIGRTNETRGEEDPFPDQTYIAKWDPDGSFDQQGDPIPGLIGQNGAGTFDWGGFTAVNTMQDSTGIYVVGRIDDATWQVSKIDPDTLNPIESKTFAAGGLGYGFAVDGTFFFGDSAGSEHIGTAFDFETGIKTTVDVNIAIPGDDWITNVVYDSAADNLYLTNTGVDEISVVHNISDSLFV